MTSPDSEDPWSARLNGLLLESDMDPLPPDAADRFSTYLDLIMKWNRHLNLTAIRAPEEISRRHFVECISCARHLPSGITTLLDYGSGAGFPGIPIALCQPAVHVTLAESQSRKAAFLREAARSLKLPVEIYEGRGEDLKPASFSAVCLRAVDKMPMAVQAAERLIAPAGWMILLISSSDGNTYQKHLSNFQWKEPIKTPGMNNAILLLGRKQE